MSSFEDAPIDPAELAVVTAPFGESRTLPARACTDDAVLSWELTHFFDASWVALARSEDVAAPGDQRAVRLGRESVLLARDGDGGLHAFFNVCRHRGHELMEAGASRNQRVIRCPYHAWVYGLDGTLKGAPHFSRSPGFDRCDYPLQRVRVHEWHGWIFADASGSAPPFGEHVGDLDALVGDHRMGSLVTAARHDYEVAANWKLITENYHECYHCPSIHPELCRVSPPDSGENMQPLGAWVGGSMELRAGAETMSLSGERGAPYLPGLGERRRREVYYFGLFPNLLISLHPDYVMTHRIDPVAPARSRVECRWLFPPGVAGRDGFDPSYATDFWDVTNREDWHACEAVQRGVSSRGYLQGPLSPREDAVYQFEVMVARAYLADRPGPPPVLGVAEQALGRATRA
jgi:phenylpropionate dioxygenase-like ring-hydroxylating dioxygenase large terminal subunit